VKKYLAIGATVIISLGVYEGMKSYLISADDYYDDYYWKRSEAYGDIRKNAKACEAKFPEFNEYIDPSTITKEELSEWTTKVNTCIKSSPNPQLVQNIKYYNEHLDSLKGKIGELVNDLT